jgi:hypothetical protein
MLIFGVMPSECDNHTSHSNSRLSRDESCHGTVRQIDLFKLLNSQIREQSRKLIRQQCEAIALQMVVRSCEVLLSKRFINQSSPRTERCFD